jgi:N6-adenosine-specific RNA methylase IME4
MKKYGAILLDPPWHFRTFSGATAVPGRTGVDPYPTMTYAQLEVLPVPALAAKDCALFLWVVDSHLEDSLDLIYRWGFKFKTIAFIWKKPSIGMGYWTRKQAEICLLATKGKPPRMDKGVRQIIEAPRREHSRKPDEQYERIERLVNGPYIELFARQQWTGWDTWGNETDKFTAEAA